MAPRTLPGLGLQAYSPKNEDDWHDWTDTNWRTVSALMMGRVLGVVETLPGSPSNGDIYIVTTGTNAQKIAVRDAGAWVHFTPLSGWRMYDTVNQVTYEFDGTAWAANSGNLVDVSATTTAPAMQMRKKGTTGNADAANPAFASLGHFRWLGWTGAAWRVGAQILAQTREAWSDAASGAGIVFQVVANGATALVDKMRLTATELWVDAKLTGAAVQALGGIWCARSGTANAITLTYGSVALVAGLKVRFRAGSANSSTAVTINLDGTGAVACRTITGVVPPVGYIRTDADTEATYDGTYWVLNRVPERGSNANGSWLRYADGRQECWHTGLSDNAVTDAVGGVYRSAAELSWSFPVAFAATDDISVTASARNAGRWAHARPGNTITALVRQYSGVSSTTAVEVNLRAIGTWF